MSSKIKFDFKSIKFRLWMYFLGFGIGVIVLIWAMQLYLLNNSYEDMKIKEVSRVASLISGAYQKGDDNLIDGIQDLSISSDIYVMMETNEGYLYISPEVENHLPVYGYLAHIPKLRTMLEGGSHRLPVYFKIDSGHEKYSTLAYGCVLDNTPDNSIYLYIFSPLYPVSSTVNILRNQLMHVTVITLLLAFVLSIYFAARISKPLKSMTVTAREMGKGNYNIKFEGNSYSEINRLAATLNTAAYELERIDNRHKDLVANVSHDLKTPLTMIRSYAEMIRDLSGDNPEKRNAHLKVIIEETDRLARLVTDMATVSAMQTHKIVLEKSVFDLTALTESILSPYEILSQQEGYQFRFNGQKDCLVVGDENRISQVVGNLVSNAIKYCGEDKIVMINVRKQGKKCLFEVIDHGPGISEAELPHVWDRYYKTSSNYVRKTEGTGLGLSIVKEILTLHHANYGVRSKVGRGSTFWFELEAGKREVEKQPRDRSKEIPQDPALIEEIE